MVTEWDLTLGGEHTMQYSDDVLQNSTLESYIILTNVTPVNKTSKRIITKCFVEKFLKMDLILSSVLPHGVVVMLK